MVKSRSFDEFSDMATNIANTVFGDVQQKETVRDVILRMIAEAYLDKGNEKDDIMYGFTRYYSKKY